MADYKRSAPNQSEVTGTYGLEVNGKERYFNAPSIERRSQRVMDPAMAVKRAKREKLLGRGFGSVKEAVDYIKQRHDTLYPGKFTNMNKAPQVSGTRLPRNAKALFYPTNMPYNPGGAIPHGGGGSPRLSSKVKSRSLGQKVN